MFTLNKKIVAAFFLVLTGLLLLVGFIYRTPASKEVTISFKNVVSLELVDITHSAHEDVVFVEKISDNGQPVTIEEGLSYALEYVGSPGYEDGVVYLDYDSAGEEVVVDPLYSRERLDEIVENEINEINRAIKEKYENINLYKIQKGSLYRFGEWYGTNLIYKGAYSANSDNLKIVLEKVSGSWQVRTDPPNISLSKFEFPDIPEDVLREVNNTL